MSRFTRLVGTKKLGGRALGVAGAGTLIVSLVAVMGPADQASGLTPPPGGAIIVSNHSGGDTESGCATPAFTSIQAAVNAAASGSTIYVCQGTYNESPTISEPLTLLGSEFGVDARTRSAAAGTETIIDGSGGVTYATGATKGTLSGFSLTGYTGSLGEISAANVGSAWTWTDNIVDVSNGGYYFNTDGVAGPAATTISDNQFSQTTSAPESGSGDAGQAVLIWQQPGDNVAISNNTFTNLSGPGAAINTTAGGTGGACPASSAGLNVTTNTFTDDGTSGSGDNFLALFCTASASVTNNTATITAAADANAESPIYLGGGDASATVSGNILSGDGAPNASGIKLTTGFYPGDNATVSGNQVSDFAQDGIRVYAGGSNPAPDSFAVSGNTVTGSGVGIGVETGSNGTLTSNDVLSSTTTDCVDDTTGSGTAGTDDTWTSNVGGTSSPAGLCTPATPGVTTTPTKSSIGLGQTNTDAVAVTGNSTAGSPTGTVTFYVCGPTVGSAPCTSQATEVGTSPVTLTPGAGNKSTATSVAFTPSAMGTWCFAGYYSGDGNYAAGTDTTVDECFTVTEAVAGVVTTPTQSNISLGTSNTDGVTVTGTALGGVPSGTVSFYECGPDAVADPCTSQANPVETAVTLVPGAGNTATATSASFTPSSPGVWCFAGYYSGNSSYGVSSDTSTDECFSVGRETPVVVTTPSLSTITLGQANTDQVAVTGNATGGAPTGEVGFYACGPTTTPTPCTSTATVVGTGPVALVPGSADHSTATSGLFTPSATGTWCFAGDYAGTPTYAAANDNSTDECFVVTKASPEVSTTPASSVVTAGGSDSDSMTVTGNATGGSPTGTATFYVCGPTPSPTACTSQSDEVGGPVTLATRAHDTSTAASVAFTPTSAGYWCFAGDYSGDGNYGAGTDTTIDECVQVSLITPVVVSKPHQATVIPGAPNTDTVTVTGTKKGGAPTGTVTFNVCGPTLAPAPCTSPIATWNDVVSLTKRHKNASAKSAGFGPTAPGYWCFASTYSGNANYAPGSDATTDECFDAKGEGATVVSAPTASTIVLGQSNSDSVTVTGNKKQGSPTGTVSFYECGPSATPTTCTSQLHPVGTAVTVTPRPKHLSQATSTTFTPTAAGTWCFGAYYSGDSKYGTASDTTTDECFTVSPIAATVVTTPSNATITLGQSNNDSVKVTGNAAGGTPTGSVTFYVCGGTPDPTPCLTQGAEVGTASVGLSPGSGDTSTATSVSYTPNATGYWCFAGYYSGNSNYAASADTTTDECFDVVS